LFAGGFGIASNYSYTASDIKENIPTVNPYPIEGLMKHNGGVTLWYENGGYEARLSANYHSAFVRNPTWGAGQLILNGAETWVGLALAKQLTPHLQLRFGIDNLTNQKVVYTSANNPFQQEVTEFGRRFNLGLSFKL
jgi:outer membrane receptor protein involved in Fe transport